MSKESSEPIEVSEPECAINLWHVWLDYRGRIEYRVDAISCVIVYGFWQLPIAYDAADDSPAGTIDHDILVLKRKSREIVAGFGVDILQRNNVKSASGQQCVIENLSNVLIPEAEAHDNHENVIAVCESATKPVEHCDVGQFSRLVVLIERGKDQMCVGPRKAANDNGRSILGSVNAPIDGSVDLP